MGTGKLIIFDKNHSPLFEGVFEQYNDACEALVRCDDARVALWEQTNPACGDEECLCALLMFEQPEEKIAVFPVYGKEVQPPPSSGPFAKVCDLCLEATMQATKNAGGLREVTLDDPVDAN